MAQGAWSGEIENQHGLSDDVTPEVVGLATVPDPDDTIPHMIGHNPHASRRRRRPWCPVLILAVTAMSLTVPEADAQSSGQPLACDLSAYESRPDAAARLSASGLTVEWAGTADEAVRLRLALRDGAPTVAELALRPDQNAPWNVVATELGVEFRVVEGLRRISNQQLAPLRALGVDITPAVVDRYKWDVFWDAPLDLRREVSGGNPPPADGVAGQPGLPRLPDEVRRGVAVYRASRCIVRSDGRRLSVEFPGLTLGSFSGSLTFTVYAGTNLVRVEAVASTEQPSVAYKYDVGLTGLPLGPDARVSWRDLASQLQAYGLSGPTNRDPVALRAANRLIVAETNGATIAAFPPPHTFFWAREVEVNVGYGWYRKDDDTSFSIGVRQGEQEAVERYLANWSLYSAPPGTEQHMAAYFYPTLGNRAAGFDAALAFTNGDVFRPLPGYQVTGSHYHTDLGRTLMASRSVDSRLSDFEVLRSAGINIAGPVDRPRDATQLEEQHWLFEGAVRHSDDTFMVLPEMENSNLLGGHWDLLFSHPVYYVDERPPGTTFVTDHPDYGRVYNIGSVTDMMSMIETEDMLVYMPHPRTKGSTGYPDAIRETPQFLDDRYRGVGWRWGMGSDHALHDFDRDHAADGGHGPLFKDLDHGPPPRTERLEPVSVDRQTRSEATRFGHHRHPDHDETGHQHDALDEVGDDVRHQATEQRVDDDKRRREPDGHLQVDAARHADDLAERADLRGRPQDRRREVYERHHALDANRVALTEEIGVGRQAAFPERHGKEQPGTDQRKPIAKRVGAASRQTVRVHDARRADDRFRAEPRGEDRCGHEHRSQLSSCDQVVVFTVDAPRHPRPDPEHDGEVEEQANHNQVHAGSQCQVDTASLSFSGGLCCWPRPPSLP